MDEHLLHIIIRFLNKTYRPHPLGDYPYRYGDKDMSIIHYFDLENEVSHIYGITQPEAAEYLMKWLGYVGVNENYPNIIKQCGFVLTPEQEEEVVSEITRQIDAEIIARILELGAEDASITAASEILGIPPEAFGEDE